MGPKTETPVPYFTDLLAACDGKSGSIQLQVDFKGLPCILKGPDRIEQFGSQRFQVTIHATLAVRMIDVDPLAVAAPGNLDPADVTVVNGVDGGTDGSAEVQSTVKVIAAQLPEGPGNEQGAT